MYRGTIGGKIFRLLDPCEEPISAYITMNDGPPLYSLKKERTLILMKRGKGDHSPSFTSLSVPPFTVGMLLFVNSISPTLVIRVSWQFKCLVNLYVCRQMHTGVWKCVCAV